jgi:hypothetical protein
MQPGKRGVRLCDSWIQICVRDVTALEDDELALVGGKGMP